MNIEKNTNLIFTEIKNGNDTGKNYELTAGEFINIVYGKEVDGRLDVGVEAIKDEDGEVVEYTPNKFFELPIQEQLEMCCRVEGERYAANVTYKVA